MLRTGAPLLALGVLAGALAPAEASAGQIVWSTGNAIWAMRDDGRDPHQLISAGAAALAATLPPASTLAQPDVFSGGGRTVLFLGQTKAFAPAGEPQACGADCSATYELSGGRLTLLGPAPAAATAAAYYETQPRITADGQELFDSSLFTGIAGGSVASAAQALVERPLQPQSPVAEWGPTSSQAQPGAGFDGAPDPANPAYAAWVAAQGCNHTITPAQGQPQASCQYAVQFGSASGGASAATVTYINEYAGAGSQGPVSLDISPDGATLLLSDPNAPPAGIYVTPVAGAPGVKPVTEVIAQPPGWTFGQARFAGTRIVFDAHQMVAGRQTGDIYTIAASCTASTCAFPANATNLTNDAAADSSDPAWTSAGQALQALAGALARVLSVHPQARAIAAGGPLRLVVRLSGPGRIVVRVAAVHGSHRRPLGALRFAGVAGVNRVAVGRLRGRPLPPGTYLAHVAVAGSRAPPRTVRFVVRP